MLNAYPKAKLQKRRVATRLTCAGAFFVLLFVLSACGGATPAPASPNTVDLITPGVLTVGSDTTYAPQEYIDTKTGQAAGFDIDLIKAVATHMGLQAKIVTAPFETIIDSLNVKRFDVIISAVSITPEREKKDDFVPYFNAGESLLVQKGNPKNINGVSDLCGLDVGVQNGSVEQTDLQTASDACTKGGKPAIKMTVLQDQTSVIQLLANGRVVATYQDSPVTDYYNKLNGDRFDIGGSIVNAAHEGIVVRKGDAAMLKAVQRAFNVIKVDGTYHTIVTDWGLAGGAISALDRRTFYA